VSDAVGGYTSAEIHAVLGVKPVTLRVWAHRGHVEKLGRDSYDLDSVVRRPHHDLSSAPME
jgi:hypothetical protein